MTARRVVDNAVARRGKQATIAGGDGNNRSAGKPYLRIIRGGLKVAAILAGLVVTALLNSDTTAGENILDLMEVDPGYEVEFILFRSGGET